MLGYRAAVGSRASSGQRPRRDRQAALASESQRAARQRSSPVRSPADGRTAATFSISAPLHIHEDIRIDAAIEKQPFHG